MQTALIMQSALIKESIDRGAGSAGGWAQATLASVRAGGTRQPPAAAAKDTSETARSLYR